MYCNQCGNKVSENASFCNRCGNKLQAQPMGVQSEGENAVLQPELMKLLPEQKEHKETAQTEGKKKRKWRLSAIFAAILAVLIGTAALLLRGNSNYNSLGKWDRMTVSVGQYGDQETYMLTGDGTVAYLGDDDIGRIKHSANGRTTAYLEEYSLQDGGRLICLREQKQMQVAEDVLMFKISQDGTGIVYLKDAEKVDSDVAQGILCRYDVKTGEIQELAEEALAALYVEETEYPYWSGWFCVSPDGDSVMWMEALEELYISVDGGEAVQISSEDRLSIPVAISNHGDTCYYMKLEGWDQLALLVEHKGEAAEIFAFKVEEEYSKYVPFYRFFFNLDYSELVFTVDGKTYFSKDGGIPRKISNKSLNYFFYPEHVGCLKETYSLFLSSDGVIYDATVCPVQTFKGTLASMESGLYYLDKTYSCIKITSDYRYSPILSEDGNSILFRDSKDKVYTVESLKKSPIGENVGKRMTGQKWAATKDFSEIYYIDEEQELHCYQKDGKDSTIAEDVSDLLLSPDGKTLYYIGDYDGWENGGTLYSYKSGTTKAVPGAYDTLKLMRVGNVIYYVDSGNDLYLLRSATEKILLLEEIN